MSSSYVDIQLGMPIKGWRNKLKTGIRLVGDLAMGPRQREYCGAGLQLISCWLSTTCLKRNDGNEEGRIVPNEVEERRLHR